MTTPSSSYSLKFLGVNETPDFLKSLGVNQPPFTPDEIYKLLVFSSGNKSAISCVYVIDDLNKKLMMAIANNGDLHSVLSSINRKIELQTIQIELLNYELNKSRHYSK